jgi:hypothetical protein
MLPLKVGDVAWVIDKSGESRGWWKAFDGVRYSEKLSAMTKIEAFELFSFFIT